MDPVVDGVTASPGIWEPGGNAVHLDIEIERIGPAVVELQRPKCLDGRTQGMKDGGRLLGRPFYFLSEKRGIKTFPLFLTYVRYFYDSRIFSTTHCSTVIQ